MISNALDIIIEQLSPLISSQKFTRQDSDDCVFVNSKYAFRITYDADKKIYSLDKADLKDSEDAEFYNLSTYLFDDSSTERDAKSVGNDFLDSLNNALGIVRSVAMNKRDVKLPTKSKTDATPGVDGFCGRFLTLFPAYKDQYKDDVALYGGFMADDFFRKNSAPLLHDLVKNGETKQLNKMIYMLDQYYCDGDYDVQGSITYSIIGEAFRGEPELFDKFIAAFPEDTKYVKQPAINMYKTVISKEKKK